MSVDLEPRHDIAESIKDATIKRIEATSPHQLVDTLHLKMNNGGAKLERVEDLDTIWREAAEELQQQTKVTLDRFGDYKPPEISSLFYDSTGDDEDLFPPHRQTRPTPIDPEVSDRDRSIFLMDSGYQATVMLQEDSGLAKALFHIPLDTDEPVPKNWDAQTASVAQIFIAQKLVETIKTSAEEGTVVFQPDG